MVIDKFEDLLEVFSGTRVGKDFETPWPGPNTNLEIVEGRIELKDCDNFVLSDRLTHKGDEFIVWCLEGAIPSAKLRVNCTLVFEEPGIKGWND
jgi:hypothetical protein